MDLKGGISMSKRYYRFICTADWDAWKCAGDYTIEAASDKEAVAHVQIAGWLVDGERQYCPIHLAARRGVELKKEFDEVLEELNRGLDLSEPLRFQVLISERGGLCIGDIYWFRFVMEPDQLLRKLWRQVKYLRDDLTETEHELILESVWDAIARHSD
jgi:hypothetical protein